MPIGIKMFRNKSMSLSGTGILTTAISEIILTLSIFNNYFKLIEHQGRFSCHARVGGHLHN
jgi:hypothetical protein